jgi:hypothetical protein
VDVVVFRSQKKYDLIVSISTILSLITAHYHRILHLIVRTLTRRISYIILVVKFSSKYFFSLCASVSFILGLANSDGRLEVFVLGSNHALFHIFQLTASSSNSWSGFSSLGGSIISDPAVASNSDGRLEVFVIGGNNALSHDFQTIAASSGTIDQFGIKEIYPTKGKAELANDLTKFYGKNLNHVRGHYFWLRRIAFL